MLSLFFSRLTIKKDFPIYFFRLTAKKHPHQNLLRTQKRISGKNIYYNFSVAKPTQRSSYHSADRHLTVDFTTSTPSSG